MFPLLRAAIRMKREERKQEAPFKTMLIGVLARDTDAGVGECVEAVDDLVDWYKLTNKNHRPLVGKEKDQAQAVRLILAEFQRRLKQKRADAPVVATILGHEPGAILIARQRSGKYIALVPENDENVFVAEHEFGARGARSGEPKRWRLMPAANRRVRWSVAYKADRFDAWDFFASLNDHLTEPEMEALSGQVVITARAIKGRLAAVAYRRDKKRFFAWVYDPQHRDFRGDPEYIDKQRNWTRRNGVPVLDGWHGMRDNGWVDQAAPWDTRTKDGSPSPYRDTQRNLFDVLFKDDRVIAEFDALEAQHEIERAAKAKLHARARALDHSIEHGWKVQKRERLFADFLAEYLDESLWKGHMKTLPRGTFNFPYWRTEVDDLLSAITRHAVETGIDLDGLTLAEAVERHFPPKAWFKSHDRTAPDREVPEDLQGIRFVAPPESEDDDEPEDDDFED